MCVCVFYFCKLAPAVGWNRRRGDVKSKVVPEVFRGMVEITGTCAMHSSVELSSIFRAHEDTTRDKRRLNSYCIFVLIGLYHIAKIKCLLPRTV